MRYISLAIMLAIFWAINSGQTSTFLIGCGCVCIGLVLWVAQRLRTAEGEDPLPFFLRSFGYGLWLMWQIMVSNIQVAKLVWSPRPRISPQLFTIPCALKTDYGIATYANSITLTPGTVTVDVERDQMLIHSLTVAAKEDLLTGTMERQVARLEGTA